MNIVMPEENKEDKRVKISVIEETSEDESVPSTPLETTGVVVSNPEDISEPLKKEDEVKEPVIEKEISLDLPKDEIKKQTGSYDETKEKLPFWVMFLAFLIGLSLGAGLIGGIFYYKSHVDNVNLSLSKSNPTAVPTTAPTTGDQPSASSSASPKSKQDLAKISVQVLNGSGISGEASKVETLLKSTGFTNIKTGNATKYDYQETEISLKKGVDVTLLDTVTESLSTYSTKESATPSATYDIQIIVGAKKK
jgi:hypothetical protein